MWIFFHWSVSSRVKELFPSSTQCRKVWHSDEIYLETCFLWKSCWQRSISCSSNWIRYKFSHWGFSNGWDSWLRVSSSPFASFFPGLLYYSALTENEIVQFHSFQIQNWISWRYGGIYIWPFFCSEIPQQSMKRLIYGLFSFLVLPLNSLVSNKIE